ncbi:hypothetical protein CDCA_CDCA09G2640 [Cyanidium caldarium]|uniref:S-adenosyl-L-methionine-dependent methyltransferase n=1 Tax=Cyanidium caldarium TaxID=2771 RepID=A0AAV9IWC2_CYACA|nr:hypothetical protein CDCA_CDCA09G2640 [Cyanidium caldarium]
MAAQREKAKASTVDQLSRIPVRTRYFDDFLLRCLQGKEQGAASNEPLPRQVVLLGAGLDMRAYRLRVPREVAFYELDLPVVMEYKLKILRSEFADRKPYCVVKYVPSDLCKDWKRDLLAAGFNPRQSSVWLLEGLTYYLDEATCRRLFQDMRSLTPAGRASWMCASFVKEALVRKLRAQSSSSSSATSRGSGESSESARPIADAQRLSRQASENAAGAALRTSSSRKWPPFVFGTDDPEKFLKPLGFYVTSVACLGDAEANYGRFAAPFRHTMYVTAFAG